MNPRTRALLVLTLGALGLLGGACTDASPQLRIDGVCGIPADAATCLFPAGVCDTFLNGHLQVDYQVNGAGNALEMVVQATNQLEAVGNTDTGQVDVHEAIIQKARISYSGFIATGAAAGTRLAISEIELRDLFTPVPSAGNATLFVRVMPSSTVAQIAAQLAAGVRADVVATVKLAGTYRDGSDFETEPFDMPTYVDKINFVPPACTDTTQTRFFCPSPGQTSISVCQ